MSLHSGSINPQLSCHLAPERPLACGCGTEYALTKGQILLNPMNLAYRFELSVLDLVA